MKLMYHQYDGHRRRLALAYLAGQFDLSTTEWEALDHQDAADLISWALDELAIRDHPDSFHHDPSAVACSRTPQRQV